MDNRIAALGVVMVMGCGSAGGSTGGSEAEPDAGTPLAEAGSQGSDAPRTVDAGSVVRHPHGVDAGRDAGRDAGSPEREADVPDTGHDAGPQCLPACGSWDTCIFDGDSGVAVCASSLGQACKASPGPGWCAAPADECASPFVNVSCADGCESPGPEIWTLPPGAMCMPMTGYVHAYCCAQ